MRSSRRIALASILVVPAGPALAHTGVGATAGLAAGFWHPLGGADHALAMLAVGWLAARIGGRALWLLPSAFMACMALGGALALAGRDLPFVELGIALSVLAVGAALAWPHRLPAAATAILVGGFAVFHGHAHGAEMPADASGLAYGFSFLLATGLLHAAGIGIGLAAGRLAASRLASGLAGGGIAAAGLGLLVRLA